MSLAGRLLHATALAACLVVGEARSMGQDAAVANDAASPLSLDRVEQLRREVESAIDLTEEARKAADEACRKAHTELQLAAEFSAKADALAAETVGVKDRVAAVKKLLDTTPAAAAIGADVPLPELEQGLAKLETQLAAQKKSLAAAESEPQTRSQRRKDIRARLSALQQQLAVVGPPPPTTADSGLVDAAKRAETVAHRYALQQEFPALESELAKYDAEDASDLVRLRADLAARQAAHTEKAIKQLKERVKLQREAAAEDSVRKARLESIVAVPVLKSYAERNHELAELARTIAHELTQAEQDLKVAEDAHSLLNKQFKLTRKKVETVGLTSAVGALLRKQRVSLPDTSQRQASVSTRRSLIDETQYQLFEYGDERQELGDMDALVQEIVAQAGALDEGRIEFLSSAARELLDRKRDYLDTLLKTCNKYFDTLVELDTTDQQLVTLSTDYAEFIDERVLWIRSGAVLTKDFGIDEADAWLVSPAKWLGLGTGLMEDAKRRPIGYAGGVSLVVLLMFYGRRLRNRLKEQGEVAAKVNCRSIRPTLDAALSTVLISMAWPLVCVLLAWRIGRLEAQAPFSDAIGQGLLCLGLLWAPLEIFRQICRPGGLGEAHFVWPSATTQSIRRRLRWFTFAALPFAFMTAVLPAFDTTHGRDSIERVCFIAGMLALAAFAFRMLSASGVLREHIAYHPGGWVARLGMVWSWAAATIPLTLVGLAFAGYYYTAQVLSWRLFATCCFMATLVILRALLLRLLFLRRRALSIDQARERAAAASAAAAAATADGEAPSATPVAGIVTETPQANLLAHSQQTRRLVSTGMFAASVVGLWLIWVQVLPALGMLDRYPLWSNDHATVAVAASAAPSMTPGMPSASHTEDSSAPPSRQATTKKPPTLSDLALAVLIAFMAFVLFRNGPGLLEMSVLQQLPLDASVRYAITTLVSYAIVLLGVVISCSTIGLEWSQVQWLATALTFGLAFGLQEMFANFVAGLIILLERPIRVGDVVTVDDVTGVVSKIRIRATSITNWDRKEYVVPNKEFITGRLLNWTLSDKVNRIVVNVGVAYGTNTERARELLLEAANNHPLVLKDPPSVATFEGFGDNSLNLVLRAYLATLDDRLEVIHQLHTAVNKAFQAEKIEIAFPQRDLHIRSAPGALRLALDEERLAADQSSEAA